jgi:hypothetical protein
MVAPEEVDLCRLDRWVPRDSLIFEIRLLKGRSLP